MVLKEVTEEFLEEKPSVKQNAYCVAVGNKIKCVEKGKTTMKDSLTTFGIELEASEGELAGIPDSLAVYKCEAKDGVLHCVPEKFGIHKSGIKGEKIYFPTPELWEK